jgi:putative transposase
MQVFGLPRHVIRAGALASRIAAKSLSNEAAMRADAVRRWQRARAAGLSADDAAEAVGVSRATLYRWAKLASPKPRPMN